MEEEAMEGVTPIWRGVGTEYFIYFHQRFTYRMDNNNSNNNNKNNNNK